jgi:hypothetical protein
MILNRGLIVSTLHGQAISAHAISQHILSETGPR